MKAVRLLEYGGQLVFDDVPTPTIARDEILVKVKSTAVNHLDLVDASGKARQIPASQLCGPATHGRRFKMFRCRCLLKREAHEFVEAPSNLNEATFP